jgi:hypothetical protein
MRPLLVICFCAAAAFAQQNVTVRGIVIDAQTGAPLAGAKVELRYSTSPAAVATAETPASGTFELTAKESGKYVVAAEAAGYREGITASPITITDVEFEPGASPVERTIQVKLSRSSSISGFLRDADTKEPVRRIPVRALRIRWMRGERIVEEAQLVLSDDDGGFHIDSVPPGEYAILLGNTTPIVASSEKKVYPAILWPEGGETDPQVVKDGEHLDLGAVDYAKVVPSRLIGPNCEGGERPVQLTIQQSVGGGWAAIGKISLPGCGVLSPLPPISQGRYRLDLMMMHPPDLATGSEEILVRRGEDAKVDLHPEPPAPFTGTLTCDCAKAPLLENPIAVQLQSGQHSQSFSLTQFGPFSQPVIFHDDIHVDLRDLPPGLVIKEIQTSDVSARIVLTDKAGALTGVAAGDSKTMPENHAVLVRWPLPQEATYSEFRNSAVNGAGEFSFDGVAAGTYRAAVIGAEQWSHRDEPGVVASWFTSADDIAIAEGETRAIRLEAKIP